MATTLAARTGRAHLSMMMPDSKLDAELTYEFESRRIGIVFTVPGAGNAEMRMIDDAAYVAIPGMPFHTRWLRIGPESYDVAARDFGLDVESLFGAWTEDWMGLDALVASAEGVHYQGLDDQLIEGPAHCWQIELASLDQAAGFDLNPTEKAVLEALDLDVSSDIWVDEQGRFVRNRVDIALPHYLFDVTGSEAFYVDIEFYDLGEPLSVSEPPPSAYTDYADLTFRSDFASELEVGDCFDAYPAAIRACEEPHDREVYAIVQHPAEPEEPFPGESELARQAEQLCRDHFASYVGVPLLDSALGATWLGPAEETWGFGSRTIVCYVYDPSLEPLVGSVRSVDR